MLLSPLLPSERDWHEALKGASRWWWTVLLSGVVSAIAGVLVLSIDWTVASLAIFVGAILIFRGAFQMLNGGIATAARGYYVATGLLSVIAGVIVLAWPGPSLFVVAVIIGIGILWFGTLNVAAALGNRDRVRHWWAVLLVGVIEILLAFWLLRRPGLTLAVAITAIGLWAIFVGVLQISLSFEIRRLRL